MRIVIIYRPKSDHARKVEEYIADFERFHPGENLETINIDSPEGASIAELYGIMDYPAVLALANDGQMQQQWVGVEKMPLMNDLAYYARQ